MSRAHYKVVLGEHAATDFDGVADWYAARQPAGLDRFLDDFTKARNVLSAFPNAGRERPELRPALRSYPVHPFVVFYTVDGTKKCVVIERILHGHLDMETHDV